MNLHTSQVGGKGCATPSLRSHDLQMLWLWNLAWLFLTSNDDVKLNMTSSSHLVLKSYTQTLKIEKRWPSIFSRSILFDPSKIMFLAQFQHCLEVRNKKNRSSNDFLFPFTLACETQNYYYYYFINFRTLNAICVWTTTRIDLKFSGDLQSNKIYSQKCFD